MSHWMFNCREVTRLMSDGLDRKVPFHRRMGIRFHLLMCRFCARYLKQLKTIRELMHLERADLEDSHLPRSLPPKTRDRIQHLIQDHLKK